MSRTKKFMFNAVSTGLYQIIVMLVGFVTPRILLSSYGSEINGLVSSITQFITYFSLVEAGIAGAATYSLYIPLAKQDNKEISAIVTAAKKFYMQAGYLFSVLVIAMACVYPFFVSTNMLSKTMIAILVIVLGAKGFLEFFTLAKYRVILTADQKTYVVSNTSTIYIVLQMLIIVVLSYLKCNIVLVYSVAIFALFVRSIILMIYVKKRYPFIDYSVAPNNSALDKRWDALFMQVLQTAQTGAPVIIATIFTTLKDVSIYSIFNMVLSGINGVLGIFTSGLSASFGDVIARKEYANLKVIYRDFEYIYYVIITIVYAVSFVMIMPFVKIYTSSIIDANYNQPLIGFLFVLNGLLFNLKTPQGTLIIAAGLYKETRWRTLTQALIIIIGGILLAPRLGIIGILIASCCSNIYRDLDLLIYVPKKITKNKISETIINWIMMGVALLIAIIPVSLVEYEINNWWKWLLYALVYTSCVSGIVIVIAYIFNKDRFIALIHRLKRMVKKT